MEELTGMAAAEVIGKDPLKLFPFLQAAGVAATIAGAFFVTDKISNAKRKYVIGEYSFEAGRHYQALEDRARQLSMYADTKHLPVYTSMDGQLTLSTAYIEKRQLSISVGTNQNAIQSRTAKILDKIETEGLSMEETEYLRRVEAAIIFIPTIGMIFTRGEIRESAIHRAVEKCEEDYKTKNSLTELPASVIQEYFRLSGNHFQDVERE